MKLETTVLSQVFTVLLKDMIKSAMTRTSNFSEIDILDLLTIKTYLELCSEALMNL